MSLAPIELLSEPTARSIEFKGSTALHTWKKSMAVQSVYHYDASWRQVVVSIPSWQTKGWLVFSDRMDTGAFSLDHPGRRDEDIPAIGGYESGYWEIVLGDEILTIRKPADPLADMRDLVSRSRTGTVEEELSEIRRSMREQASTTPRAP